MNFGIVVIEILVFVGHLDVSEGSYYKDHTPYEFSDASHCYETAGVAPRPWRLVPKVRDEVAQIKEGRQYSEEGNKNSFVSP